MDSHKNINYTEHMSDNHEDFVSSDTVKDRTISIDIPKKNDKAKLFRHPAFAAVVTSLVTCVLCLFVFSLSLNNNKISLPAQNPTEDQLLSSDSQAHKTLSADGEALSIPEVYDKASPAVVSIMSTLNNGSYIQSQTAMSSGSGVIISEDGYIVTNNHVIDGAASIRVQTIANQSFDAKLIGKDERTDLAVLKVECDQPLPFAELGDSSLVSVGDLALSIGNPLREELAGTLTVGYISAINRSMIIDEKQMTMLQTDAAINPGNSGGALLNLRGQLIGINTAKSTGYDVEGLGFAIPINEAKPIVNSIIENGYVTGRPLVGIGGRDVTEAIAKANDLPIGVYVQTVTEFGAAERAGIRVGDVITEFDNQKITSIDEINKLKDAHKPGDTVKIKLVRQGKTIKTELVLQEEKPASAEETDEKTQSPQQKIPEGFFNWFN